MAAIFIHLCDPFPSRMGGTLDWLLTTVTWQRGWDVLITLQCNLVGVSRSLSLYFEESGFEEK